MESTHNPPEALILLQSEVLDRAVQQRLEEQQRLIKEITTRNLKNETLYQTLLNSVFHCFGSRLATIDDSKSLFQKILEEGRDRVIGVRDIFKKAKHVRGLLQQVKDSKIRFFPLSKVLEQSLALDSKVVLNWTARGEQLKKAREQMMTLRKEQQRVADKLAKQVQTLSQQVSALIKKQTELILIRKCHILTLIEITLLTERIERQLKHLAKAIMGYWTDNCTMLTKYEEEAAKVLAQATKYYCELLRPSDLAKFDDLIREHDPASAFKQELSALQTISPDVSRDIARVLGSKQLDQPGLVRFTEMKGLQVVSSVKELVSPLLLRQYEVEIDLGLFKSWRKGLLFVTQNKMVYVFERDSEKCLQKMNARQVLLQCEQENQVCLKEIKKGILFDSRCETRLRFQGSNKQESIYQLMTILQVEDR